MGSLVGISIKIREGSGANITYDILTFIRNYCISYGISSTGSVAHKRENYVKAFVVPFINTEVLAKILESEFDWDFLLYLQEDVPKEIAW